jgi:predicted Rossmann fold flavoprotein
MRPLDCAIIGGGASGITAAISAKRAGKSTVLLEKTPRLGRKLLASGNGRCNLLNEILNESFYNPASTALVKSIFAKFSKSDIIAFFKSVGVYIEKDEAGRYFPVTNQSATVLKALEIELKKLSIPVELDFEAVAIVDSGNGFAVTAKSGRKVPCGSIILTGGGKSYPSFGSDGGAYKLAAHFGHSIIEPVPACVSLVVKDPLLHPLQGQKITVRSRALVDNKVSGESAGDLLFTRYGLSGTAILDISDSISVALNRGHKKDVCAAIDMVPFLDRKELEESVKGSLRKNHDPEDILVGILPNKFGPAMKNLFKTKDAATIAGQLKDWRFKVIQTRGWNEAEFTAGGVDTSQVYHGTLESKLKKGLYFAGEILDVNGARGGYNLAWAWASGYAAGRK